MPESTEIIIKKIFKSRKAISKYSLTNELLRKGSGLTSCLCKNKTKRHKRQNIPTRNGNIIAKSLEEASQ
jgi:hypothetical protein